MKLSVVTPRMILKEHRIRKILTLQHTQAPIRLKHISSLLISHTDSLSSSQFVSISVEPVCFLMLHVLEFCCNRKRGSVVVELPNSSLLLCTKGTDAMMLPLLHPQTPQLLVDSRVATQAYFYERRTAYSRSRMERHPTRCCIFCVRALLVRCAELTQRLTHTYKKSGSSAPARTESDLRC